jgi:malate permease and related proteins
MPSVPFLTNTLLKIYIPLMGTVLLGWGLSWKIPKSVSYIGESIGKFLFWFGVPVSIVSFLRGADIDGGIWIATLTAWVAIVLGVGLGWGYIKWRSLDQIWTRQRQGSFLLASMFGNTGYLGYPVILSLLGAKYFAWAIFYDLLGTTLGAYSLGVIIASRFSTSSQPPLEFLKALLKNPVLWSFALGMAVRLTVLPDLVDQCLRLIAWISIFLSLLLMGIRLSQLSSPDQVSQSVASVIIKMLIVPIIIDIGLLGLGLDPTPKLILVLQAAMPPAFATLVISEVYNLDRRFAVTAIAIGTMAFLVLLPVWLFVPS